MGAHKRGKELGACTQRVLTLFYALFNIGSVVPMFIATANGPVAVVIPVAIASQLLSNMVIQSHVGALRYSKAMRVGTYILAVAALQLIDVGPADSTDPVSPLLLITQPWSVMWLTLIITLFALGLIGISVFSKEGPNSMPKLMAYTLVIAIPAALNNSLSKLSAEVDVLLKFVIFILYTLLGWLSTVVSAWGNQSLNNALSVPCFSCAQVITNGLTGIFVWGDMARLQDKVAYLMVYVLIVLGIYLCAHVDMVSLFFSKTQSPVRDSVQDLLDSLAPSTSLEREKTVGVALTNFLHEAQDQHIAKSEMRDLLVSLIDVMEENDALKPEMAKKVEAWCHRTWAVQVHVAGPVSTAAQSD